MKARIMIDSAPFGADDLRIAREAFDGAWEAIAHRYSPSSVEAARERLAKLVLSLVPDTKDPAEIRALAVQEMTKGALAPGRAGHPYDYRRTRQLQNPG